MGHVYHVPFPNRKKLNFELPILKIVKNINMAVLAMAKPSILPTNTTIFNQTTKVEKCPAQQSVEKVVYDGYEFEWTNKGTFHDKTHLRGSICEDIM